MEGVIKQWFMWVKPNFEKVRHHPRAVFAVMLILAGSLSTHRERMEVSICPGIRETETEWRN